MTEEDPNLVARAEKLAAELPLVEPDWEAFASRVEKEALLPPAMDEALLLAPALDAEPGEASEPAKTHARPSIPPPPIQERPAAVAAAPQRESVSLADLARATMAKRGSAESANIAKESLSIASERRNLARNVEEAAPQAAVSGRQAITIPPARTRHGDSRSVWIGVGIAAVGLAAGFGLYVTAERETIVVAGPPAPAVESPAVVSDKANRPPSGKAPGASDESVAEAPRGVSLDALEREAAAPASSTRASGPVAGATPGSKLAQAPTGGSSTGVKPERVILEENKPGAPVSPQAAGRPAGSAVLRPAELGRDGGAADRPSAGAAQAAVGAVLGAARACIAGRPSPSSATIVFGSSGEVSQVSVGGEAAGTPAASCIESALKKARVQPFAAPTFSLAVTVRPP
jgi:hypothetical protein